jgi:MFS family permease
MITAALAPSVGRLIGAALYGVAGGIFIAVDWALMTDIIPRASSGRHGPLSNVATGSSGPSVIIGGIIADLCNRWLFIGAGMRVSLLIAAALYVLAAWACGWSSSPAATGSAAAAAA